MTKTRSGDSNISSSIYLIYVILGLIFVFPYLVLVKNFQFFIDLNWSHFFQALQTSIVQSLTVILICGVFSLISFRGLYIFNPRIRDLFKNLLIVPVMLPSIFTILIALSLMNPFPFGLSGVVIIFLLIYFGYFFVAISEAIENKLGDQYLIKETYGISTFQFFLRILIPQIKQDLFAISLIVFVGCFSSLSVPLIASGGRSVNFELFIYETIFIANNWSAAIILALIQSGLLLVLGLWMRRYSVKSTVTKFNEYNLKSVISFIPTVLYILVYFGSLFGFAVTAFFSVRWSSLDVKSMVLSLGHSLKLFIAFSAVFSLFLVGLSYLIYQRKSIEYFKFFLTPSSIIVGFSYYLFFAVGNETVDLFKMTFALFTVNGFSLYFNFLSPKIELFEKQIIVSKIYNLDFSTFFQKILWPQIFEKYFLSLSVILLISLTDFAVIKAVGSQTDTLGTFIYNFLSSYRLEWAFVFTVLTLVLWFLFLVLMRRGFDVLRKKS